MLLFMSLSVLIRYKSGVYWQRMSPFMVSYSPLWVRHRSFVCTWSIHWWRDGLAMFISVVQSVYFVTFPKQICCMLTTRPQKLWDGRRHVKQVERKIQLCRKNSAKMAVMLPDNVSQMVVPWVHCSFAVWLKPEHFCAKFWFFPASYRTCVLTQYRWWVRLHDLNRKEKQAARVLFLWSNQFVNLNFAFVERQKAHTF